MNTTVFEEAYLRRVETIIQSEEINALVANALRFVIQNIFSNIASSFTFTISSGEGPVEFWLHDVMNKLFTVWSCMALQLVVLDKNLQQLDLPGRRFCNMIMIDSFKSLEKSNIDDYNRLNDNLEYYFIFLQVPDDNLKPELEKIFRYCFDNYWLHCNVMAQNSKGDIYIYTYFPFQDGHCFQTEPVMINQFIGNRFMNTKMFPDKLKNLHLCPLKLSTWHVPPFIVFRPHSPPKYRLTGFEMVMINAISRKMNFTIEVKIINIVDYRGPTGYIIGHESNISMGYFRRTLSRDQFGTASVVTYYLPMKAIILGRKDHYESVAILTFPFDKYTWILLIFSYISVVLLNSLQHKSKTKVIAFKILEVLMGMSLKTLPTTTLSRIRLITWIMGTFILRSIYQSLLFYLFRTQFYKPPPVTLADLAAAGYKAVCIDLSEQFVLYLPEIVDEKLPLITLDSSNELDALRYLEGYSNENFAAITVMDFVYYFVAREMEYNNALQILPVNANEQQIGIYLTKHSYLIDRFNEIILQLHQAGLLKIWRELHNYSDDVVKFDDYFEELMVNFKQLLGIYVVMLSLNSIAILVFLLELMSKKVIWLKKLF